MDDFVERVPPTLEEIVERRLRRKPKDPLDDRDAEVRKLRAEGYSMGILADRFGVSKSQIWQIVHGYRSGAMIQARRAKEGQ